MEVQYPLVVRNTSFIGNRFSSGTAYIVGTVAVTFDNATFSENVGNSGCGILIDASESVSRTFTDLVFRNNSARISGAGIYASGLSETTLVNVVCEGNRAYSGGCFAASQSSALTLVGGSVTGNTVLTRGGAGLFTDFSTGVLENTVISGNTASSQGGGIVIDVDAFVTLNGTVFSSNSARYGGAVSFSDVSSVCATASRVAFRNNTASLAGGAIFFDTPSPVCTPSFCSGCTYAGNDAIYGAILTSRPASIVSAQQVPSSLSPLQSFDMTVELRDYFGVAVKRVRDFAASVQLLSAANGTRLRGIVTVDVDDDGLAKFSFLKLSAPPGSKVSLSIVTSPETTNVTVQFSMAECGNGTEPFVTPAGEYTCLVRVDTTWQVRTTFIVITSVFAALALLVLILVIVFRKNPVLRRSSIVFCSFIAIGALFLYASTYMFLWNTDATCALRPWILIVGFSLAYGSLFIKEWRLWRLFDVNINTKIRIDDAQLLRGLSVLVAGELGMLIIWFAVSPFVLRVSTDLTAETITYQCGSTGTTAVFWILVGFNSLLLLAGCIIAFLVRNLPSSFNESSFMAFSIYTVTLTIIVCLAISGTQYQPNVVSIVASIGILFSTTVTLGGLFVPKFLFIFFKEWMLKSLADEVDRLQKDIRWKQRQIAELHSSNSSKTGSTSSPPGTEMHQSKYSLQDGSGKHDK